MPRKDRIRFIVRRMCVKFTVEKAFVINAMEVQNLLTMKQGELLLHSTQVAQKEGQELHKIIILNGLTVIRKQTESTTAWKKKKGPEKIAPAIKVVQ